MKKPWYYLVQFTWGILQNLAGCFWFLCCLRKKHSLYHGAILTRIRMKRFSGGWTFGCFIFLTEPMNRELEHDILIHEYGHTFQSLLLGPFYLLVIGLPSTIWASSKNLSRLRREKNIPYSRLYCEKWASKWGEKVSKEEADWT